MTQDSNPFDFSAGAANVPPPRKRRPVRGFPWVPVVLASGAVVCVGMLGLCCAVFIGREAWSGMSSPADAATLYQRAKSDPSFAKSIAGKRMQVIGRVAKTNMFPGLDAVSIYLEHGPDPNRFMQDRIMVLFVPRDRTGSHYKGFDIIPLGGGVVRFPWANGEMVTVTGTVNYRRESDMLSINDATLD